MKGKKLMHEPHVYDKAKYHHDSPDFPKDLPIEQASVHTGMFLGWVIDNDLYSEDFRNGAEEIIDAFKKREITGAKVFEYMDGVLTDQDLSDEGNAFAQDYFDFDKGGYLKDYEEVLASKLPSFFHVKDTWENYKRLKQVIGRRYNDWKNRRRSS